MLISTVSIRKYWRTSICVHLGANERAAQQVCGDFKCHLHATNKISMLDQERDSSR